MALTKPDNPKTDTYITNNNYIDPNSTLAGKDYVFKGFGHEEEKKIPRPPVSSDWRCQKCGKVNAGYVGTCGCGEKRPEKDIGQAWTTESQLLYCTSCGKQIEPDSKFCGYCGAKVNRDIL